MTGIRQKALGMTKPPRPGKPLVAANCPPSLSAGLRSAVFGFPTRESAAILAKGHFVSRAGPRVLRAGPSWGRRGGGIPFFLLERLDAVGICKDQLDCEKIQKVEGGARQAG